MVKHLRTIREAQLQSQHFLLYGVFDFQVTKNDIVRKKDKLDLHYLKNDRFLYRLREKVLEKLAFTNPSTVPITEGYRLLTRALSDSAQHVLPVKRVEANRPWISECTLNYINLRNAASVNGETA